MSKEDIKCPFCGGSFSVDVEWIKENKRVFCPNCCKAFDVDVENEEDDFYGDFYD